VNKVQRKRTIEDFITLEQNKFDVKSQVFYNYNSNKLFTKQMKGNDSHPSIQMKGQPSI